MKLHIGANMEDRRLGKWLCYLLNICDDDDDDDDDTR
jgi:hypothetical protein